MFMLADADCFYVSVEKLFDPTLRNVPVVALSNSDGAVVSRCPIAKSKDTARGGLGIKMGAPFFEIKHLMKSHGLRVVSSNYALYQNVSNRFMQILTAYAPASPYSIDEAWLDFSGVHTCFESLGRQIQADVKKQIGIGIGVGFGTTKTLAKAANRAAKTYKKTGGVVGPLDDARRDRLLSLMPVEDVWNVGRKLTAQMNVMGISTALDLQQFDHKTLRRSFNVNVEKTALELAGVSCFRFEESVGPKQTIASTRSFGERVTTLEGLREAVATYVSRACVKLRSEGQLASCLQVFVQTSRFDDHPYSRTAICGLEVPSADTRDFVAAALAGLQRIYVPGYRYAKAGIVLSQFCSPNSYQSDLFAPTPRRNADALMGVIDQVNARYGRGSLRLALEPPVAQWAMKRDYLSASFTTDFNQLKSVKCQ
ncbi:MULTISPECIES: Y-family DNA polymerase [unclassified Pseudomonas]|uniref:Y-family DNA polymerase n=1 Tax=unclassified Pseudomonas TaxID=196821 RepID=UPI001CBB1AE5|nr:MULTISPECIES: Y-family DNA polymerase [unclassified Pseudomonas]